jgi:hypothetical protein
MFPRQVAIFFRNYLRNNSAAMSASQNPDRLVDERWLLRMFLPHQDRNGV